MRKLGRVRTKTEPKVRQDNHERRNVPNVGASLASIRMAMLVEKMSRRGIRRANSDLYDAFSTMMTKFPGVGIRAMPVVCRSFGLIHLQLQLPSAPAGGAGPALAGGPGFT